MNRIAYLASEYPAPSHTFIRREIAALRRAGVDILPFSIRPVNRAPATELERAALAETVAVLGHSPLRYAAAALRACLGNPSRAWSTFRVALAHRAPGAKALTWAMFHLLEAFFFAQLLRRAAATRVHNHFANSGATVGMLAAHFNRMPWSMTLHGVSETDYPAGLLLADKVARADFVACASWFMRAQAMRVADAAHWGKLHVVRCGVDLAALPAQKDGGGSTAVRFICVGRLSPEKWHRGLLDAFAAVRAETPGAELVLVGDGPLRPELERLAGTLGIGAAVSFRGALDEAATLAAVAAADVLVLASLMEGLPVVLLEGMALGKPVISSAVAGIPELVRDGQNGLLFPASQSAALARHMKALAADAGLRERLGAAGRVTVAEEFAIDIAVRPLVPLHAGRPAPGVPESVRAGLRASPAAAPE
jgi:glycosyltransferase involved in cell wall biosynthesis